MEPEQKKPEESGEESSARPLFAVRALGPPESNPRREIRIEDDQDL